MRLNEIHDIGTSYVDDTIKAYRLISEAARSITPKPGIYIEHEMPEFGHLVVSVHDYDADEEANALLTKRLGNRLNQLSAKGLPPSLLVSTNGKITWDEVHGAIYIYMTDDPHPDRMEAFERLYGLVRVDWEDDVEEVREELQEKQTAVEIAEKMETLGEKVVEAMLSVKTKLYEMDAIAEPSNRVHGPYRLRATNNPPRHHHTFLTCDVLLHLDDPDEIKLVEKRALNHLSRAMRPLLGSVMGMTYGIRVEVEDWDQGSKPVMIWRADLTFNTTTHPARGTEDWPEEVEIMTRHMMIGAERAWERYATQ